jgi:hypothetical protein
MFFQRRAKIFRAEARHNIMRPNFGGALGVWRSGGDGGRLTWLYELAFFISRQAISSTSDDRGKEIGRCD